MNTVEPGPRTQDGDGEGDRDEDEEHAQAAARLGDADLIILDQQGVPFHDDGEADHLQRVAAAERGEPPQRPRQAVGQAVRQGGS